MSDDKRRPVDFDEMFPGRFLKAGLLQTKLGSRTPIVTITDIELETMPQDDGKNKDKGIISIKEASNQICLNRTNGECLKAMFGKRAADWIGKRIGLCIELDRDPSSKNGKVEAIRIAGSPAARRTQKRRNTTTPPQTYTKPRNSPISTWQRSSATSTLPVQGKRSPPLSSPPSG